MSYIHTPRGDVKRLPKWAQEYIDGLQREITRQDKHIKEISSGHPGSNVVLDPIGYAQPEVTLPPDSVIRFYLSKERNGYNGLLEVHVNRQDPSRVEVRSGGGPLSIIPHVSNAVTIGIAER